MNRRITSLTMCLPLIVSVLVATVLAIGLVVSAVIPPISWLPETNEASAMLGTLLTAQAAIAALTLAVTLFVMQGASARQDADDRTYREYVRRSWVRQIFWSSLIAVGITGMVLLIEGFVGASEGITTVFSALRNLALLAVTAFLANLVLAAILFERSVRLAQPEHWRSIRRFVNERDVIEAVQVFLKRLRAASGGQGGDGLDPDDELQGTGEGSANEAIQVLLDDGRRAMDERRQRDFARSMNSIRELIEYSMKKIEEAGIRWGTSGTIPKWPPLRELYRNLGSFREDVIRRGDRENISELLRFDHWAVTIGTSKGCGELLKVGLDGYDSSYRIAIRMGHGELPESFLDQIWQWTYPTFSFAAPRDIYPSISEMVLRQERLLNVAMHADRTTDYVQIHKRFEDFLDALGMYWWNNRSRWPEAEELYGRLEEDYIVALMGLGGRALLLADSGRLRDPSPYLDILRGKHAHVEELAHDLGRAFDSWEKHMWMEWAGEDENIMESLHSAATQYPLTWFTVRLMELCTDPNQTLGLHGSARRILTWFEENSAALRIHLRGVPELVIEERSEYAAAVLRATARKEQEEEVADDNRVVRADLSQERVSAFEADVYYGATRALTSIERLFERVGAFLILPSDSKVDIEKFQTRNTVPKVFLADLPGPIRTPYRRPDGQGLGLFLSDEVISRFCETLDRAPQMVASLCTTEDLLRAIREVVADISPVGELVIVLAGDWGFIPSTLIFDEPDGFQSQQNEAEPYLYDEITRYNDHPILYGPEHGERRLYVVELQGWGQLVRMKSEGDQGVVVKVEPVSVERAQALLASDVLDFPDELDEKSKLRKIQTHVEIVVSTHAEFRVFDPYRARRVVGV